MTELQTKQLSDVLESAVSGFASGAKDASGVAQVRMNNVETDGSWDWSSIRRIPQKAAKEKYYLHAGDVLFNATNSPNLVGKSAYFGGFDEPVVFSNHFVRLRVSPSKLDGRYLARWLNLLWKQRLFETRCTQWVNQATYRKDDLLSLSIPLPPLTEQKRIAGILDAADALRAKRRAALAELDALLQSTFLEMFGDPVTNPMGWERVSGEDVCTRITVGIVVKPASYYQEEGIPALRSLNVKANRIDTTDLVYVSKVDNETTLKKTRLWKGDVVLVRSGQPGTAAVVPEEMDGINAIDILIATPDETRALPTYLCHYFNSHGGKLMALGEQRGQIQKHLNVGALKAASIPLPGLELQRQYSSVAESIERQRERMNAHLAELDALFASLQSRAFNGEL